ncbi:MAG: type II toxin-antitoxin system RatA family toxin [Gammaproteobacteria bacterium]|nr:MAG: type II toxin-antitoxin system RatA family toxin [Gammaproteobacteria bacterium]
MPYSTHIMYTIVNDVAKYPEFLPWCSESRILSQNDTSMKASILMKKGRLNHWFSTQNMLEADSKIEMSLIDGPFKRLDGVWKFIALDQQASKIILDLNFEFSSGFVSTLAAPVFTQIANTLVASFCTRAHEVNSV